MKRPILVAAALMFILVSGCGPQPTPTPTYSLPQLKYRLFAYFGDVFWCDPDFYPIGQPEQELQNAIDQFPTIRADQAEFAAILEYLSLSSKENYTYEEKLLIYRQHKKLTYAVTMTVTGDAYHFTLRVGQNQGYRYDGIINQQGRITALDRERSFNT
jgi:hypothetical protein